MSPNDTFILGIWHQSLLSGFVTHRKVQKFTSMASPSKDGDYAALTSGFLGVETVRGSSSRGGAKALTGFIHAVKSGRCGAITIDGPRGPSKEVKRGIIEAAKVTGSPILPAAFSASRYWEFRSWDKFRFPKPFSTITIKYSDPILVPADSTTEDYPRFSKIIKEALERAEEEIS